MIRDSVLARNRMQLLGLVYLLVVALLVLLSVQIYRKAMPWQHTVHVSLSTSTPGLELHPQSDVKLQGVRVGEVRSIESDGTAAVLDIALDPDQVDLIPRNVDAAIVPKTLFGEKFVDLHAPENPSKQRIGQGDRIEQSTTSVELDQLFTHLEPVLETLKPEQLSTTLSSLADALQGRGAELGQTIDLLHTYLTGFNPQLDTVTHDIQALAKTADLYTANAPALLRTLSNGTVISRDLLVPREQSFGAFLDTTMSTANTASAVLRQNAGEIVTLAGQARPVAQLLDEYSSEFPCLIHAFTVENNVIDQAAGGIGPFVNLSAELVTRRAPYRDGPDSPRNPASDANNANLPAPIRSWAPHCAVLPERFADAATTPAPPAAPNPAPSQSAPSRPPAPVQPGAVVTGAARQRMADLLAAHLLGVPEQQAPAVGGLLLTPLLSDGTVSVP